MTNWRDRASLRSQSTITCRPSVRFSTERERRGNK